VQACLTNGLVSRRSFLIAACIHLPIPGRLALFLVDRPIEQVLSEVEINLQRYQYAEQEVSKRRQRLLMKEPELKQCLDAIDMLVQQRDAGVDTVGVFNSAVRFEVKLFALLRSQLLARNYRCSCTVYLRPYCRVSICACLPVLQTTLDFALSDQVYARAKVSGATNTVGIWLGANVMVEYELEEAKELLVRTIIGDARLLDFDSLSYLQIAYQDVHTLLNRF
jgi:prefoldin subunit 5